MRFVKLNPNKLPTVFFPYFANKFRLSRERSREGWREVGWGGAWWGEVGHVRVGFRIIAHRYFQPLRVVY